MWAIERENMAPGIKAAAGTSGNKNGISIFVPLSKIDPDQRMVYGYASTDTKDMEGETITLAAMTAALPGYMRFANLREMHQLSAIGVTKTAEVDGQGLYIGGKIVDNDAWDKVKAGVYKGFSIGGTVTMRDPNDDKIITGLDLIEISAVDRPANPDCLIDMWKAVRDGAVRRPVQKWDCGIAGHDHGQKADAVKCIEGQTEKSATLRSRLIKAVDALDQDGLEAAVGALEKSEKKTDKTDDGTTEEKPDIAGDHAADTPEPDRSQAPSTKAAGPDEEKSPKAGDLIAFTNDKYADAGPSSGTIASVDGNDVKIDHGDHKGEAFKWDALGDPELKLNDAGQRIWLVKAAIDEAIGAPGSYLVSLLGKADAPAVLTFKFDGGFVKKAKEDDEDDEEKAEDEDKKDADDDGKEKPKGDYGDHDEAGYADPGFQEDKKPRYPLKIKGKLSEKRIRAAWNYINKPGNQKAYTAAQVEKIKNKIIAAWKSTIDKDGPPSADDDKSKSATNSKAKDQNMNRETLSKLGQPDAKSGFKKGLIAAASAIYILDSLKDLQSRLGREAAIEGDDSTLPARVMAVVQMFSECCQALLEEEVEEMLDNKEIGDYAYPGMGGPDAFCYAQPVVDLAKSAIGKRMGATFLKTVGDRTGSVGFDTVTKAFEDLVQKGQEEWSGSKPEDDMGTNDKWDASGKPEDDQKNNDAWPAEMKEAAQKVHDQAVKMGATCEHGVVKSKKKADDDDGKKNPPAPKGSDDGDDGDDKDSDSKSKKAAKKKDPNAGNAKDKPDEDDGASDDDGEKAKKKKADKSKSKDDEDDDAEDGDDEDDKKSSKKAQKAAVTDPTIKNLVDTVGVMKGIIEEMAERLGTSRNPPLPSQGRQRVDKSQDGPTGLLDGAGKVLDPNSVEGQQAVLRGIRSRPNFVAR